MRRVPLAGIEQRLPGPGGEKLLFSIVIVRGSATSLPHRKLLRYLLTSQTPHQASNNLPVSDSIRLRRYVTNKSSVLRGTSVSIEISRARA